MQNPNSSFLQYQLIWREIGATWKLALPIIGSQLMQNSLNVLDTMMVGQVSVTAVAACSFAVNLFVIPLLFGFGFLGAVPVLVARAHGRGDFDGTIAVMRQGSIFSLIISAILAGATTLLSFHLNIFKQPPELNGMAQGFLILLALSLVPVYLGQTLKQVCEALHAPWAPLAILCMGLPINAALNWVFIYGHLGVPAMGLMGAGCATLLSRTLMFIGLVVFVRYVLIPKYRIALANPTVPAKITDESEEQFEGANKPEVPGRSVYYEMLYMGLPIGFQLLLEAGYFSFASVMMGWISAESLAAHQIAMSVASTTFMIPLGVMIALTIRVSHAYGKRDIRLTRAIARGGLILAAMISVASSLAIGCFPTHLASIFIQDPGVIHLAARFLTIAALFQFFDGIQLVASGALRGINDVQIPTAISFSAYWLICLPLSYLLAFPGHFGGEGIWWAIFVALVFAAGTLVWRLERRLALVNTAT